MRVTERAHEAVGAVVRAGESVVDATVGNGHDTLFLASCVGPSGSVIGFDVQQEALARATERLRAAQIDLAVFRPHWSGHENLAEWVTGPVAAVMFNLGYLPGGDHTVTTRGETTVRALRQAWKLLRPAGILSVVCYRGHPSGAEEAAAVVDEMRGLAGGEVEISGREETENGPFLVAARKNG